MKVASEKSRDSRKSRKIMISEKPGHPKQNCVPRSSRKTWQSGKRTLPEKIGGHPEIPENRCIRRKRGTSTKISHLFVVINMHTVVHPPGLQETPFFRRDPHFSYFSVQIWTLKKFLNPDVVQIFSRFGPSRKVGWSPWKSKPWIRN